MHPRYADCCATIKPYADLRYAIKKGCLRHPERFDMKLIFIRHAEPDYENNTLTEKGFREAEILSERTKNWDVTKVYSSPLERARFTAAPSLKKWGKEADVREWLQEFTIPWVTDDIDKARIVWDFLPSYLDEHPELFDKDAWLDNEIMHTVPVAEYHNKVITGFDALMAEHGYIRNGAFYNCPAAALPTNHYMVYDGNTLEHMKDAKVDETTLVFFCHLGVMSVLLAHLMNVSPAVIWHGCFVATSSVTVLCSEERTPGEAYFRCQCLGDTSHLRAVGEKVSYYGYFTTPFQG